jgi:hypothetical protein
VCAEHNLNRARRQNNSSKNSSSRERLIRLLHARVSEVNLWNRRRALPENFLFPTARGASILSLEGDASVSVIFVKGNTDKGHPTRKRRSAKPLT